MEIDKFLPPKFTEAMKDLADLFFSQSTGQTNATESRIGLTSMKSEADHQSHILMNEVSPKINHGVQLPYTILEQRQLMNDARKKISSQGQMQKTRKSILLPTSGHV